MSAEAARDVLQRRAVRLARPLEEGRPDAVLDLVVVTAGSGHFALDARAVRSVLHDEPLCRLAQEAGALLAVAIVGGETVPVADLAALLDGGEPRRDRPFLVVLEDGEGPVGFLVDEVREVVPVHLEDLRTVGGTSEGMRAPHRLMTPDGAVVLDTGPLLSDERLVTAAPAQITSPPTPRGAR